MSLGPLSSLPASAAGAPLAQSTGSDAARAKQETAAAQRSAAASRHADDAAGISQADGEDHQSDERDADGRLPWEIGGQPKPDKQAEDAGGDDQHPPGSRDATGERGGQLDLSA